MQTALERCDTVKIIDTSQIAETVERLCIAANYILSADIRRAMEDAVAGEGELGREVLHTLLENADLAWKDQVALCQDTGMAVVFVEIGQQVVVEGGGLTRAINEGVRRGYERGFLRKR